MKKLHIATSPLTNNIYVGGILKNGYTWATYKQDVTIDALVAVAQHTIKFGQPVVISKADGTPEYDIIVRKLWDIDMTEPSKTEFSEIYSEDYLNHLETKLGIDLTEYMWSAFCYGHQHGTEKILI